MARLIDDFIAALRARGKAIKRKGRLELDLQPEAEQAHIYLRTASGVRVILRLHEGGYANVFLQRTRRPRRGRTLARLEGIRIPISGRRAVACFEATIDLAASTEPATSESDLQRTLHDIWKELVLEVVSE